MVSPELSVGGASSHLSWQGSRLVEEKQQYNAKIWLLMTVADLTGNKEEKYKFWKKISNFTMFPFAPNPTSLLQGVAWKFFSWKCSKYSCRLSVFWPGIIG